MIYATGTILFCYKIVTSKAVKMKFSVPFFCENLSRNAAVRVRTDGYTDTYGADNKNVKT